MCFKPEWQTMWTFHTPRYSLVAEITPDYDLDLSWDESGETRAKLESGEWQAFGTRVRVIKAGVDVGEDSIWGSVYANPADFFKEHYGSRPGGWGSYFPDLVRGAVQEARTTLAKLSA